MNIKDIETPKKRSRFHLNVKPRYIGILLTILPPFLICGFVLLVGGAGPQLWDWPYDYPNPWPLGRILVLSGLGLLIFTTILSFYWAYHLLHHHVVLNFSKPKLRKLFRVVSIVYVITAFGVGGALYYYGIPMRENWLYDAGPYITWGSDQEPSTGITINWHSNTYTSSVVHYGINRTELDNKITDLPLKQFHHIAINGLLPNTTYYYQAGAFLVKQFTTAPEGEFNFTFFWWSDPRTNNGLLGALRGANLPLAMSKNMQSEGTKLAFSLCTGDITSRGVDLQTWRLWLEDITTNDFASNWSHQVISGNHERHDDRSGINFKKFYPYKETPINSSFSYSFDYGNTHFVMLDPWDVESGWWGGNKSVYASWLEADLIAHTNNKFTVLAIHPNPILNDGHSGNQTVIMNIARQYGVDLVLCGHWHSYDTYDINGTEFEPKAGINNLSNLVIMLGMGGNTELATYAAYAQIDVSANSIIVRPRWIDGRWMETFIIS